MFKGLYHSVVSADKLKPGLENMFLKQLSGLTDHFVAYVHPDNLTSLVCIKLFLSAELSPVYCI